MPPELGGLTAVVGGGEVVRAEVAGAWCVVLASGDADAPGDPWVGIAGESPPVDGEFGEFDVGVAGAVGRGEGVVGARAGSDDDVEPVDGDGASPVPVPFGATGECAAGSVTWDACVARLDDARAVAVQPAMVTISRIATASLIQRTCAPGARV